MVNPTSTPRETTPFRAGSNRVQFLLKNTSAIVLCGGLGTRLRPVLADIPKALAPIGEKPFLDILLFFLKQQGIQSVILAIGYGGDKIKKHCAQNQVLDLVFSEETSLLGTGGAFRKALAFAKGDQVIVVNGDTLCPINYADLLNFHLNKSALLSMVLTSKNRHDVGGVRIDAQGLILDYEERPAVDSHSFMSAGIYIFKKEVLALIPKQEVFSLEYDFLPKLVKTRQCFGYITKARAIDIGTPERYSEAQNLIV